MWRYIKLYGIQLKNNWVREAVYRTNFLTTLLVDSIWIVIEFILFSVIYANVTTLAGWNKEQVFFFLGVFFSSDSLFSILFTRNFWQFSDLVNKGELDILLTKPVSALFLAITRWINITGFLNLVLGLAIMGVYAKPAGFIGVEHPIYWLAVPVWLCIGLLAQLVLRFFSCIWVFWTERSWAISYLYYQLYQFATRPDSLYPLLIRYGIMTVLPFAFIGSVPARALLHGLNLHEYVIMALSLGGFTLLNLWLWQKGLKRYQSASS